jgi:hypothetical protein
VQTVGEHRTVWFYDGEWLEAVTPTGVRSRGARSEKPGPGTGRLVKRMTDWLNTETGGVVSTVGFTVDAKK